MKILFKISGCMMIPAMITTLVGSSVYAEEPTHEVKEPVNDVVEFTPDTSKARTRLQVDYALKIGEETIDFIRDYQTQYQCAVPKTIFTRFVDSLLRKGDDPIIQAINYVPEQSVILTMHSHSFVESTLQSNTVIYHLIEGTWLLDLQTSTAPITPAIGPPPLPFYYCMSVITNHCQKPIGYQYPDDGFWSDEQWCPEWHKLVRPLPLALPLPPPEETVAGSETDDKFVTSPATYSSRFIIPLVADFPYCVGVLTNHCKNPLGITTLNLGYPAAQIDTWSDNQWCPAWHNYVGMPPQ